MRIVALVGSSGTGKSHRAIKLAHREGLNAVIDDGLLISEGKIVAGSSAKLEDNKMRAVRRAIFMDAAHVDSVKKALVNNPHIRGILILGTSDNMIEKITTALDLPRPEKTVYIEEITSERDRKYAYKRRHFAGEHVVPLPHIELKESWADLIDRSFKIVLDQIGLGKKKSYEKTIVKTRFSYLGRIKMSDNAVADIIRRLLAGNGDIARVNEIRVSSEVTDSDGKRCADIYLTVSVYKGDNVVPEMKQAQKMIKEQLEKMTTMYIRNVNVEIGKVCVRDEKG